MLLIAIILFSYPTEESVYINYVIFFGLAFLFLITTIAYFIKFKEAKGLN
jgi:phosphatidylglycerophosphate synthase